MVYLILLGSIVMEIAGTTMLKYSDGFTNIIPTVVCLLCYTVSFFGMAKVLQVMDMGIAYATWCALGIVATSAIGAVLFKQELSTIGMVAIALITVGVVLLNLYGKA